MDFTQAFIDRKYLVDKGPADILLYPDALANFLKQQGLMGYFVDYKQLKVAYFKDVDLMNSESASCVLEFNEGRVLKSASIQVMLDSLLREEHLCPVRIDKNADAYELRLAPLSQANLDQLDGFYEKYRINIALAYRVRRDVLNLPFQTRDLPSCLTTLFINQNAVYEEQELNNFSGISVSAESINPNATIMASSPEELMKLFKK